MNYNKLISESQKMGRRLDSKLPDNVVTAHVEIVGDHWHSPVIYKFYIWDEGMDNIVAYGSGETVHTAYERVNKEFAAKQVEEATASS